jgi:hypothetical protein
MILFEAAAKLPSQFVGLKVQILQLTQIVEGGLAEKMK